MNKKPILFAGSSHLKLAQGVSSHLKMKLGQMDVTQFPDGETHVQILEDVRGRNVFVLQAVVGQPNHYLFELLIIVDALKRASAKKITAIIPYLGYCRQDRKDKPGVPVTAKLVANMLETAGIGHLITCDLHADQMEGFFEINVEHLHCQPLFVPHIKNSLGENCMVVAPDIGSVKIAERMAKLLNAELAVIKKERLGAFEVNMALIGAVDNKNILIADDLCSTGNTLVAAANLCRQKGAKKIIAAMTHGLFADDAIKKIESSPIESLFVTDTVNLQWASNRIQVISVVPLIAEAIQIVNGD